MSTVTVSAGSAVNSAQVQLLASAAPPTERVHLSSCGCGVGPADSPGKSFVTYWPGGTRAASPSAARRRWKPRVTGLMTFSSTLAIGAESTRSLPKPGHNPCPRRVRSSHHGRPGRRWWPDPAGAQWVLWRVIGGDGGGRSGHAHTGEDVHEQRILRARGL